MDWKLELIVVPVSDVDRAKAFYSKQLGFKIDVDGAQTPGLDPQRGDYNTFLFLEDPDGNGWMVQEVRRGARASRGERVHATSAPVACA